MIAKNRVLSLWSQNKKLRLRQFGPATAVAVLLLYCGIDYCCTTAALYSSTAAVHHGSEVPIQYVLLHSSVCVCVCVFFPSILDIKFVGRTSRGHTGGRSHRIFNPPSFCGACLDFCREKDSAIPFPRRP